MSKALILSASLLLAASLGGCFSYVPLRQPDPRPEGQVRLRLSPPGDFRLADITLHDVALVEGELVTLQDSAVVLSATRLATTSGFERLGQGATVRVPRGSVASFEIRRLARGRTALFAGGLVALALAGDAALRGGGVVGALLGHRGTAGQ